VPDRPNHLVEDRHELYGRDQQREGVARGEYSTAPTQLVSHAELAIRKSAEAGLAGAMSNLKVLLGEIGSRPRSVFRMSRAKKANGLADRSLHSRD
jgi:hypothetical protein